MPTLPKIFRPIHLFLYLAYGLNHAWSVCMSILANIDIRPSPDYVEGLHLNLLSILDTKLPVKPSGVEPKIYVQYLISIINNLLPTMKI